MARMGKDEPFFAVSPQNEIEFCCNCKKKNCNGECEELKKFIKRNKKRKEKK